MPSYCILIKHVYSIAPYDRRLTPVLNGGVIKRLQATPLIVNNDLYVSDYSPVIELKKQQIDNECCLCLDSTKSARPT